MQQVQLFIEDQRIELFKDEVISLTETIQNVKDIAKVFTDFTKTFSVPATKETINYLNTITILISLEGLMQEQRKKVL